MSRTCEIYRAQYRISMKKKKGFLVTKQPKFGAMGHQALLEHSLVLYKLFPLFIVCLM